MTVVAGRRWRGRIGAVAGILLLAFSMRSAVASLSPVLDHVQRDIALSPWVIGVIGTAPPVSFAVFGLITPALERRFGLQRLALVVLAAATIGLVGRGFAGSAATLLAASVLIFASVGVGNVLLPPLIKRYFPDRIGLMTSLYATVMAISTFVPPLVAVPVADGPGWRMSLAMWAVFSGAGVIPWIGLSLRSRPGPDDAIEAPRRSISGRMARLPLAWALAVCFGTSSVFAYTFFAWLPAILMDISGVSHLQAGALLSLFAGLGLPLGVLVPMIVARSHRAVGALFAIAIAAGVAGLAGLLWAPHTATWLWIALVGLFALIFPLVLVLLNLRSRTHEASVALSGFVQSVGYGTAAVFPLAAGYLHTVTGGWTAELVVLAVVALCAAPAALVASRPHTVEDEWIRRHGVW